MEERNEKGEKEYAKLEEAKKTLQSTDKKANEDLAKKTNALQKEIDTKTKEIAAISEKLKSATEKQKDTEVKLSTSETNNKQLKGELDSLANSIQNKAGESEKNLALLRKEKEGLAEKIAAFEKAENGMKDELDATNKTIIHLNNENKLLKTSIGDLNKSIVASAKQLSETKSELDKANSEAAKAAQALAAKPIEEVPEVKEAEVESSEVYNIFVSIMPQEDEFELELPAEITGMEIISELIDAEVLHEDMNFAINVKRTGEAMGGDESLLALGVQNGDFIVIETE